MSGLSRRPTQAAHLQSTADITLVFDGGSLGNPGKGYGSFVYTGVVQTTTPVKLDYPGKTTNNEAEYMTMLHGIRSILLELERDVKDPSTLSLHVFSDSKLVVEQVSGRWKVRQAHLLPLRDEAQKLLSRFARWQLTWHPRIESVKVLGH